MEITRAFVLGAGLGTRLRPLTNVLPKPLVPVWNEPLVWHSLRHCQRAGITDFAINTHHLPQMWSAQFPDDHFEGSKITFFREKELLDTGGGLRNISSFIGRAPILVYNGDILTNMDIGALIEAHRASNNIATLAVQSEGPNCNITVKKDQVVDLRRTLLKSKSNHQFTGIYCVEPSILEFIPPNQKISIIPAFLELAKQGRIGAFNVDSANWCDIGTIEAYRHVHQSSKLKNIDGSFLSESSDIGARCEITDSIIWPGSKIRAGSKLQNCIVFSSREVSGSFVDCLL